jgi:hypothetical protein
MARVVARVVKSLTGPAVALLLLGGAGLANAITASGGLRAQGSDAVLAIFDGNDFEIFRLDGSDNSLIQMTDNDFDDLAPRDSGSLIVWSGFDGNDFEIFRYDGTDIFQITVNEFDDVGPSFFGSDVRWSGFDGNDFEIFRYDGTTTVQLTDNEFDDRFPQSSGFSTVGVVAAASPSVLLAIPEPGSLELLAFGVTLLGYLARRRGGGV